MYRRWPSKTELVLDAVAHMKAQQVSLEALPDTGTLRGDLLALFHPQGSAEIDRILRAIVKSFPIFAEADINLAAQIIPSVAAYRALILRTAIDRALLVRLVDGVVLPALRGPHLVDPKTA